MARFDLYIDTNSGDLVAGPNNSQLANLPRLVQGDTISLRIYLLARTTTYPNYQPFEVISTAGLALKVGIGPKNGTAGSTLLTQQFTWSTDANNQYFYADLPLNTAAIASAIGANESAGSWFEVEYTSSGLPTTVLQRQIAINAEVVESGTNLVTPPGATAISAEEANAVFLKRTIRGAVILENADGSKQVALYVDTDGTFRAEPLT